MIGINISLITPTHGHSKEQKQCCSGGERGAGILIVVVGLDFDFNIPNLSLDSKTRQRREGFFTVLRDPAHDFTTWTGGGGLPVTFGDYEGCGTDRTLQCKVAMKMVPLVNRCINNAD